MEGEVKFFNKFKGFGFIKGDDGEDYFVHFSSINKGVYLEEKDKVKFTASKNEKGYCALNVDRLEG